MIFFAPFFMFISFKLFRRFLYCEHFLVKPEAFDSIKL